MPPTCTTLRGLTQALCRIKHSCTPYANGVYSAYMLTIIESPLFTKLWPDYWSAEEHGEFAAHLASNPDSGDLIPGSGGCRKIRWTRQGMGKRGGVRVIYTVRLKRGAVVLLTIYSKSVQENIPSHILRQIAEELDHD